MPKYIYLAVKWPDTKLPAFQREQAVFIQHLSQTNEACRKHTEYVRKAERSPKL